jgi:hypothetical protein
MKRGFEVKRAGSQEGKKARRQKEGGRRKEGGGRSQESGGQELVPGYLTTWLLGFF